MSQSEFTVTPYDNATHRPALSQFLSAVYQPPVLERRLQLVDWIEEQHPYRARRPMRFVIMDGEKIAATMGHLPCDFIVEGKRMPARYTHDLLVDPTYRGKGLAKMIVNNAIAPGEFLPGGMWMTGTCYQIHLACGFDDAPTLVTRTLVLDPRAFTARQGFTGLKRFAGGPALSWLRRRALARAMNADTRARVVCTPVERFDAAQDDTWLQLAMTYRATLVRSAAYVNWKYMDHPILAYRAAVAWRDGAPCGFVIWRRPNPGSAERRGVIADFLVANEDAPALDALIAFAVRDVAETDAEALSTLSTQPWTASVLKRYGFLPRPETQTWVVANWSDHMPQPHMTNASPWHTCMGDSDGDFWSGCA